MYIFIKKKDVFIWSNQYFSQLDSGQTYLYILHFLQLHNNTMVVLWKRVWFAGFHLRESFNDNIFWYSYIRNTSKSVNFAQAIRKNAYTYTHTKNSRSRGWTFSRRVRRWLPPRRCHNNKSLTGVEHCAFDFARTFDIPLSPDDVSSFRRSRCTRIV